jgi:hypothetical protein
MNQGVEHSGEFRLIQEIAEALRAEIGPEMEDQPGFRDSAEAGQVNRAFCIMAQCVLQTTLRPGETVAERVTSVLLAAAWQRLEFGGLTPAQTQHILQMEPAGRIDWHTFLILTGWNEILRLLEPEATEAD